MAIQEQATVLGGFGIYIYIFIFFSAFLFVWFVEWVFLGLHILVFELFVLFFKLCYSHLRLLIFDEFLICCFIIMHAGVE